MEKLLTNPFQKENAGVTLGSPVNYLAARGMGIDTQMILLCAKVLVMHIGEKGFLRHHFVKIPS
jgi:hypothetical protein